MLRRELLRSLTGLPLIKILDKPGTAATQLPKGEYLIFVDAKRVDIESLAQALEPLPIGYSIVPVMVAEDKSIDDIARIYRMDREGPMLCESCATDAAMKEREQRAFAHVLPSHLHLYDFGDGVTIMPKADFANQGSYLTSRMCYLEDSKGRLLPVDVEYLPKAKRSGGNSIIDTTNILEAISEAAKRFDAEAVFVGAGQGLPTVVRRS